jgi:glycine/D-amino acid oxidase-like deaminating enzyme
MNSIWHEKTNKVYPQIDQDMQVQTLVVGGGIAGYMAAYFLAESGHEVVLIEKNTLFSGVTKNTTGFITALQDLVCQEIEKKHVTKIARQYFESQQQGIDIIDTLVKKHAIDCDFVRLPTYLFARGGLASLKAEFAALKRIGAPVQWQRQLPALSLQTTGVIKLDNQAQFHPIKFLRGLPQNFAVYENSKVTDADFVSKTVFVGKHKIVAQNIVMATHYPIFNYPELFFARMYQSQSYCLAYKTQVDLQGMYVEDIANGLTFRNQNQHLIVGGFDHRVGRVQKYNPMERLQRTASQTGHENSTHQWYAQDCVSFDYLPFAGQIKDREGCFVITGFNKWGMANSAICAQLVCETVFARQNNCCHKPQKSGFPWMCYNQTTSCKFVVAFQKLSTPTTKQRGSVFGGRKKNRCV